MVGMICFDVDWVEVNNNSMRLRKEYIEENGNELLNKLMIHTIQPCPIYSYSRDLQHGPCCGHDTFYQLVDCSSVSV